MLASITVGVVLAAIGFFAELFRRTLAERLKARPDVIETVKRIEQTRRVATEKRLAIEDLHRRSAEAQGVLAEIRVKANALERRLKSMRRFHKVVAEVGTRKSGQRQFYAAVTNPRAGMASMSGDKAEIINEIFAKEVDVVIWAASEQDALSKLAINYPGFAGYETALQLPLG